MRLRMKVLVCLMATLIALLAALHYIAEQALLPRFEKIEYAQARAASLRMRSSILDEIDKVSGKSIDWANWTDAADFVQDKMPDFVERNIQPGTLEGMKLSLIMYADRKGEIKMISTLPDAAPGRVPDSDARAIHAAVNSINDGQSMVSGVLRVDGQALIFSRHPVRDSGATIEPVGTCLFGRRFGPAEIETIADESGVAARVRMLSPIDDASPVVQACLADEELVTCVAEDEDNLSLHALLKDAHGAPLLLLTGSTPRVIYREGASTVNSLWLQLVVASLVLSGTTLALFEILVLSRISSFSSQIGEIARTQDLSNPILLHGHDEVARLALPVNMLLSSLREAQKQLVQKQELLETSEQRLALALEAAGEGLWDWDMSSGALYFSGTWARMLGYLEDDVPRSMDAFMQIVHPEDLGHVKELTRRHLAGEASDVCADLRLRTGTGTWKWVLVKGRVVHADSGGRCVRMIGTHQDIDDRRLAELELRHSREKLAELTREAQEANRTKSEFLANMSHEIRTPMSAILGYTDLLLEGSIPASQRNESLLTIRRNGQHLLALINDILDLSKVEAGKMTVERIGCDPIQIVAEVESLMRVRAGEKHLSFVTGYDGRIPRRIKTDPTRLRQVLLNLVSNAIKFTHSGEVSLRMKLVEGQNGAPSLLRFVVSDSGIGMSPDQLQNIFKPFHQADTSTTRKFGGTGLGLAICKRLVEILGGSINVCSTPGAGTQVGVTIEVGDDALFELPAPEPVQESAPRVAPAVTKIETALTGLRILLAEDGADNQRLISFYLTRSGATVELAENGEIAIHRIDAATLENRPFDVVLMDMQMPTLDGYAASTQLRERGFVTPIIALTAHAMAGDRAKCIGAGCTDYLTKPVDRTKLIETILSVCPQQNAGTPKSLHSVLEVSDPGLSELVKAYVDELPRQTAYIVNLMNRQNFSDLRRLVHQIKGAGGGYGFPAISDAAADAEQTLRVAHDLQSIRVKVDGLIELLRSVQGYDRSMEILDVAASLAH